MAWGQPISIHPAGFAPDLDPGTPGILLDCDNLFPTIKGVRVLPQLVPFGLGLDGTFQGGFVATYPDGTQAVFAGTADHLYKLVGNLFTENDGSQTYKAGINRWRYAQFLTDTLATDYNDVVQRSVNGAAFAALPGNPPRAKIVGTADPGGLGAFAFVFNLVLADGTIEPDGWGCSAIGDDTNWPFTPDFQSAHARLATEPGPITGAHALQTFMIAYKEKAIYTGLYVGGNAVWDFQERSGQVGLPGAECVADLGDRHALFGGDNFYTFDGYSPLPIPNAPRDWFFDNADANFFPNIWTEFDRSNGVVYWHFASNQATPDGTIDTWLAWNINNNRWTKGRLIVQGTIADPLPASLPMTYGQFGNLYGTYGNIPATLLYGDRLFDAQNIQRRGVFTTDGALQIYSGPPATRSYATTGWIGDDLHLSYVSGFRPRFSIYPGPPSPDDSRANLTTYTIDILGDDIAEASLNPRYEDINVNIRGTFNFRQTARFHQFKMLVYTDAEIVGWMVDADEAGIR